MVGRPEPSRSPLRRLDALGRASVPATVLVALMVLASGPTGLPGGVGAVALPCVVFWSIFRPGTMPPPVVFGLGLLHDLLSGAPLGVGIVTFLLAHGVAVTWQRPLARQSFLRVWLAFCSLAVGAAVLGHALSALLAWNLPPLAPALHQAALAIGLYPLLAGALGGLHATLMRAEDRR